MNNSFDMYGWRRKYVMMAEADNDPELVQDYDPSIHGHITSYDQPAYLPTEENPETVQFSFGTQKDPKTPKILIVPYADLEAFIDEYDAQADCRLPNQEDYLIRFFELMCKDNLEKKFALELAEEIHGKPEEVLEEEDEEVEDAFDTPFMYEYFSEEEDTLSAQFAEWLQENEGIVGMYLEYEDFDAIKEMCARNFPDADQDVLMNLVNRNL